MDACLLNCLAIINLSMKSLFGNVSWNYLLGKLSISIKISYFIMFILKKNVKYFSSIYLLHHNVVILSIVVETVFLWYLENDLSHWLQMWQYQFSQVEEATRKICDALRNLILFVQFKKREKHPWRSVNFSKVAGLN